MMLLVLALVLLVPTAVVTAREVGRDGLGRRPGPRSHTHETPGPWGPGVS